MLTLSLVTLAATAALCRRALESWAAPGALLALFWLVQVVPGLPGDGRDVPPLGIAWIALSCLSFAIGGAVGQAVAGAEDEPEPPPLTLPAAEATMLVGTLLGLGFLAIRTVTVGPSWSYSGDDDVPILLKPAYAAQFATPALGGMALAVGGSRRRKALALATLAPAVATLLLSTRRTVLLLALLHAAGGYLAARAWVDRGRVRPFSGRRLALMVPAAAFLVAAVFVAAAVRVRLTGREASLGDFAASALDGLDLRALAEQWPRIRHLFFGYLLTFSQWIELNWSSFPAPEFGAWTFSGPFTLLDLADRPYAEDFEISPGVWTNVYGAFHGLILDFSPVGSLLALLVVGLIGGVAYRRTAAGDARALPALIGVYVAILYSFISSPLRYNVACIAIVYVGLYARTIGRSAARSGYERLPVARSRKNRGASTGTTPAPEVGVLSTRR